MGTRVPVQTVCLTGIVDVVALPAEQPLCIGGESMGKRANGEGSVYRRKSDGRWVGSLSLPDGTRKVFYGKKQS